MNKQAFAKRFPLGSHLCREPMPAMGEMKRDMELLKKSGYNLIKLQENWAVDESLEGKCDFSRYEELIHHAAKLDMGVYLGMTCEQAPAWLWEKHPDCRMETKAGAKVAYQAQSTNPADGKPGPCYDHDGARADMLGFVGRMVRALGKHENIVVWNTWQEIAYWPERLLGPGEEVCFCPNTIRFFQQWLREEYGDLDALNRRWNTNHGGWESVLPERIIGRRIGLPVDIAWKHFMENVQIARVLRERARVVRENDPLERPVFAHVATPKAGSPAVWTYARCQDFVGTSSYPLGPLGHPWDDIHHTGGPRFDREQALNMEVWDKLLLRLDILRSAHRPDQPLWVAELQSGPSCKSLHKGRVPDAEDIRRWMLGSLFCGATAIAFWVTRAEIMACELNGFSLLDSEGDTTERFEESARIGRAIQRYAELFAAPNLERGQVAILVDGTNHYTFASLESGGENLDYSIRGWHRQLLEMGIGADFLRAEDLEEQGGDYRALILPFPVAMDEIFGIALRRYVERGGHLICEACPGRLNGHGYANRGELSPLMAELCGVKHSGVTMVREPGDGVRWTPQERTWGEFLDATMLAGVGVMEGEELRANYYLETFTLGEAQAVLRHGQKVAGTGRSVGKGAVWLLGTVAGHNGTAYGDDASRSFVRKMLSRCGVEPPHPGRLVLRRRTGGPHDALLLYNPTREAISETIDVSGYRDVVSLLGEVVEREEDAVGLTVPAAGFAVLVCQKG